MSKNLVYIGIGILAIIAIFMGYKIYQQQVSLNQPTSKDQSVSVSQPITEEEKLVKADPLNATLEERTAYRKKLDQFAKDATTVEITNCKPNPLVARVKENTAPNITNNDNAEHVLRLGTTELKVPAKGTISVKIGKIDLSTNFDCVGGSQGTWIPQ